LFQVVLELLVQLQEEVISLVMAQMRNKPSFFLPQGVDIDRNTNFIVSDTENNRIRRISSTPDLTITTIAGNSISGFFGDNGPGTLASLSQPSQVTVDKQRNWIYIADFANLRIRKLDENNIITTIAGTGLIEENLNEGGQAINTSIWNPSNFNYSNWFFSLAYSSRISYIYCM
jgi:hypothetical protein